jgi:RecB family endonuclease NucS
VVTWSERDVEDYLCENHNSFFGQEYHLIGRQINIGLGIIDILLIDEDSQSLVVVEIKKDEIDDHALSQVMRYIVGVEDYIQENPAISSVYDVKGILLGRYVKDGTSSALRMIQEKVEFIEYTPILEIEQSGFNYTRNKDNPTYKPNEFNDLVLKSIEEMNKLETNVGESNG